MRWVSGERGGRGVGEVGEERERDGWKVSIKL